MLRRCTDFLSSTVLTVFCLVALMILVIACTLAQVRLGVNPSVAQYIRSFIVWWRPEELPFPVPVFPGGGLVGGVLLINLGVAQFLRLERSWRKAGLWIMHFGLALLLIGEFATALLQVESRMSIEEGQTVNFSEDTHRMELAVIDVTDGDSDDVRSIPESLFKSRSEIADASLPFVLRVHAFYENAQLRRRGSEDPDRKSVV